MSKPTVEFVHQCNDIDHPPYPHYHYTYSELQGGVSVESLVCEVREWSEPDFEEPHLDGPTIKSVEGL